jgi:hypothetical protein
VCAGGVRAALGNKDHVQVGTEHCMRSYANCKPAAQTRIPKKQGPMSMRIATCVPELPTAAAVAAVERW